MNSLRKLQLIQLDLLLELKKICKKTGISYFLVGGSMIGAVRHRGFIPWDDDIDVGMLREDYDKFLCACQNELSKEYRLYNWDTDADFPLPFSKLMVRGTKLREDISSNSSTCSEIFIDIFPLDAAPSFRMAQIMHGSIAVILKKALLIRMNYRLSEQTFGLQRLLNKSLYAILKILTIWISTQKLKNLYEWNAKRYDKNNTTYVVNIAGAYSYIKELKKRYYFNDLAEVYFEGENISIPTQYDLYLKEVYGNYMQLPSKECRVPRHTIFIDFGNYNIKNKKYKKEIQLKIL